MCQVREGVSGDGGDWVVAQTKKIFKTVRVWICERQRCDRCDGVIASIKEYQRGREDDLLQRKIPISPTKFRGKIPDEVTE